VEPRQPDPDHNASDDLLAGYALGILTPEERATLAAQLATDPALRAELGQLTLAADALPLGLEPVEPSPGLRNRLEAAVFADLTSLAPAQPQSYQSAWPGQPPPQQVPGATTSPTPLPVPPARRPYPINAWAIAAALLLVISVAAVGWGIQQSQQSGPPMRTIALEMTDAAASASGELAYVEQPPMMMLMVEDMPPLPPDQVYEVWLIPHAGDPIPAGFFADTSARHALAGSPDDYQAVAITMEPGPMGTMAPTTAPLITATLGD
jgi:anti-sigma-K factor RskA